MSKQARLRYNRQTEIFDDEVPTNIVLERFPLYRDTDNGLAKSLKEAQDAKHALEASTRRRSFIAREAAITESRIQRRASFSVDTKYPRGPRPFRSRSKSLDRALLINVREINEHLDREDARLPLRPLTPVNPPDVKSLSAKQKGKAPAIHDDDKDNVYLIGKKDDDDNEPDFDARMSLAKDRSRETSIRSIGESSRASASSSRPLPSPPCSPKFRPDEHGGVELLQENIPPVNSEELFAPLTNEQDMVDLLSESGLGVSISDMGNDGTSDDLSSDNIPTSRMRSGSLSSGSILQAACQEVRRDDDELVLPDFSISGV